MMAGEMATAMRLGAGIVFILMTDAHLSLISIKQEKKGHDRYGTQLHNAAGGYKSMDTLFGVPVFTARNAEEYDQALKNAFAADSPVIVEVFIKMIENE